jgi:hypothetical protein
LARVFSRAVATVFLLTCVREQFDRYARIDISFGLSTLFWFQTVFWFSFDTFIDRYRYDGFRLVLVLFVVARPRPPRCPFFFLGPTTPSH